MNTPAQLRVAQYISDEYMKGARVVSVEFPKLFTARLTFEDGTWRDVNGKFAVDIHTAKEGAK